MEGLYKGAHLHLNSHNTESTLRSFIREGFFPLDLLLQSSKMNPVPTELELLQGAREKTDMWCTSATCGQKWTKAESVGGEYLSVTKYWFHQSSPLIISSICMLCRIIHVDRNSRKIWCLHEHALGQRSWRITYPVLFSVFLNQVCVLGAWGENCLKLKSTGQGSSRTWVENHCTRQHIWHRLYSTAFHKLWAICGEWISGMSTLVYFWSPGSPSRLL